MCIENYFLEIRNIIHTLETVVNALEETVTVIEEALEASPRLRDFITNPDQWLQLWCGHIDSFRESIRDYDHLLSQTTLTPQQVSLIYNSTHTYTTQVKKYVQLVQAYCLSWLADGGEDRFLQIEDRIHHLNESLNNLTELADVSLVKERLLIFRNLVLAIETLVSEQAIRISASSASLGEETVDRYRQLVALLQADIATWESRIAFYESTLDDRSWNTEYFLEAHQELRVFVADLSEYTHLVQRIYRNLLEL